MRLRPWRFAFVLFLAFSLLLTGVTCVYLNALQNLSLGPRTERMESGLGSATFREADLFGKKRVAEDSFDTHEAGFDNADPLWLLVVSGLVSGQVSPPRFHPILSDRSLDSWGVYRPMGSRAPPQPVAARPLANLA